MKRTARIATTIAAIALTVVIMCVGILAATKVTLNSGNSNISFTATDVSATVSATKRMGATTAPTALEVPNGGVYAPSFETQKEYSGTIEIGNIDFTDPTDEFILEIEVKNTFSSGVYVGAVLTVDYTDTNGYLTMVTTTDANAYTSGTTYSIAAAQKVLFRVTIKITQDETKRNEVITNGFSGVPFSFSLVLSRTSAPETPAA